MPRPSKKEERAEEILLAYEKCIAKYGVEGATLQKIADEAQIARPLLRHNIGNSDELLKQVVQRYTARSITQLEQLMEYYSPPTSSLNDFAAFLFQNETHQNDVMIASALIISSQENSFAKKKMSAWFKSIRKIFFDFLKSKSPKTSDATIEAVSDGIIALYFNFESLTPLGSFKGFKESSLRSTKILLSQLK